MQFPKYLETVDGQLVIFEARHKHSDIARLLGRDIVSGGMMCALSVPKGRFFGESTSLLVSANKSLDWSTFTWFQATVANGPIFVTDVELLAELAAKDILPAIWRTHEDVIFPSSGELSDKFLANHFLP